MESTGDIMRVKFLNLIKRYILECLDIGPLEKEEFYFVQQHLERANSISDVTKAVTYFGNPRYWHN